jgi:YVTN family beta-propeller protein
MALRSRSMRGLRPRGWARGSALALASLLTLLAAGGALAGRGLQVSGRVGPQLSLLPSGRHLTPQGRLVDLGNYPTGAALTRDGHFYWTVSTGRGINDVRIVSVASAKVVQVVRLPGGSGGVAMDPSHSIAYVSGVADSGHRDERTPDGTPGRAGDVVHVFSYDASGHATAQGTIPVPPSPNAPDPQNFPPQDTLNHKVAWPDRLAVSPDGKRLLVPLNLSDAAAVVDVASKQVRYVDTGHYPYGAAILPDGKTGLVSNETPGTVSVIDLGSATKLKDIQVGAHLSHPEGIAVDPGGERAYVALANSDQVVVIDAKALTVARTLSTARPEGDGTSPVDPAVTPDGRHLVVAEAGADELTVFGLPSFAREGRIPVASTPQAVAVAPAAANFCDATRNARRRRATRRRARPRSHRRRVAFTGRVRHRRTRASASRPHCAKLVWLSARGLDVGPNPNGPNPYVINDDNALSQHYLPGIITGMAGVLDFPDGKRLRAMSALASAQIRPSNPQSPPSGTPLRPDGPIKHVFYVVKENRTYDQVLGDDSRGEGDPNLAIFGRKVTPNVHALAERFPLLDHVYANSEASIDGHFWTSAGKVSDYVEKNWNQNYGDRDRPYDFGVFEVTWPQNGFLFDQAERQGTSWFNFGEAIAGVVPNANANELFPGSAPLLDKDRTAAENGPVIGKFAKSDLGAPVGCYPNDAFLFKNGITQNPVSDPTPPAGSPPNTESRFDCFKAKFNAQVATGTVPAFTYMILPQDHTEGGKAGAPTPRAYLARNDYALGQVVDLISHSPVWSSSAIFVIEDDSQDGADHIDAHRIPAAVISPYARPGAVVHTRYDFLSVIRSFELILGLKPLGLWDNLATPMYDAFQPTPSNGDPYTALAPTWDVNEKNPSGTAAARMSAGLNLRQPDQVSQRTLDRVIWKTVHGDKAEPPPPGPNAVPGG